MSFHDFFLIFFECNIITCKHQCKVLTYNQDVCPGGDELQVCTDTKNQVILALLNFLKKSTTELMD